MKKALLFILFFSSTLPVIAVDPPGDDEEHTRIHCVCSCAGDTLVPIRYRNDYGGYDVVWQRPPLFPVDTDGTVEYRFNGIKDLNICRQMKGAECFGAVEFSDAKKKQNIISGELYYCRLRPY